MMMQSIELESGNSGHQSAFETPPRLRAASEASSSPPASQCGPYMPSDGFMTARAPDHVQPTDGFMSARAPDRVQPANLQLSFMAKLDVAAGPSGLVTIRSQAGVQIASGGRVLSSGSHRPRG